MLFKAKYKAKYGEGLKILTPKQMLQRLPISFAQVKASTNSENLLNEIKQIVYYLHQSKEIVNKVYNNIIKSIRMEKMDTIFKNCLNSKTFKPQVLILKFTDKFDLRRSEKSITLSDLSIYYIWKKQQHENLIQQ